MLHYKTALGLTTLFIYRTAYVLFVCFPGAALAVILAIAVAIGMIIFLIGLIYIRRFGPPWFCTYSDNV